MKTLLALLALAFSGIASANEDHLIMIPTSIRYGEDMYIVNRPMISGYGADFEAYCSRIAFPYLGDVRSPSSKEAEVDLNAASLAKIQVSADLPPRGDNTYKVTIDYSNAAEDSKSDRQLLRAIITCVYRFGDSSHGHLGLKADFTLIGIAAQSELQGELERIIEARKQQVDKGEKSGAKQPPGDSEFE